MRQVIVRIRHLPADSALAARGLAGEPKATFYDFVWSEILNEMRVLNWRYLSAHTEKDRNTPEVPDLIQLAT